MSKWTSVRAVNVVMIGIVRMVRTGTRAPVLMVTLVPMAKQVRQRIYVLPHEIGIQVHVKV